MRRQSLDDDPRRQRSSNGPALLLVALLLIVSSSLAISSASAAPTTTTTDGSSNNSSSSNASAPVACGTTITESTHLGSDVGSSSSPCPSIGIVVGASGITLDCDGHTIYGASGSFVGVLLSSVSHVTVKDCIVAGFTYDFYLYSSSYNGLYRNTVENAGDGFYLASSPNNRLSGNVAQGNEYGYSVDSPSTGNLLRHNSALNNANTGFIDVSTGSGTAGTANTYTKNLCSGNPTPSTPTGLC